jgi:hypothetical protein
MKVFISWSGDRSQALANALRDWLPLVLHYVEPWLSQADIGAGERWADAVAKLLDATNFGILCVTRENVASPWVLFEAGALAKSMQGSRVIPLLFDLDFRDISGPLAQFQAKKFDKAGVSEVIQSINGAESPQAVPEGRAKQLFEALWPEFEKAIASVPKHAVNAAPAKHIRPQTEVLEELVASVRALDIRSREIAADDDPRQGRPRRIKFHPMMVQDIAHMIGEERGDAITLLIVSSMFRENAPWLYELGMEAYRAAKGRRSDATERTLRTFLRAVEALEKGHFPLEELGLDPRAIHYILRNLRHFSLWETFPEPESIAKDRVKKGDKDEIPK